MNGTEQNEKNRRMKPERILEMFCEVVTQHASKSHDFPISNLLDQYMQSRLVPNFPEAAMVIDSAGHVYSRKVDYLECLLMAMHDKQNAPDRTERPVNPEEAEKATEKKRLPGKRLKNVDHTTTTIQLAPPKHIKKSTSTVEKMNLNPSEAFDSDTFKNYCQALKSKIPVFYERVNLLISDKTDSYFDGARPISKEDPDCQKNYNVFVGCISFKEKQMMSQREFLNRIQFDNLDGGFDQNNSIVPGAHEYNVHNSTAINSSGILEQSSIVAGDLTCNNETDLFESLRETSQLMDSIANNETGANDDCDSAMVDDDASQLNSTADESTINNTFPLNSTEQNTLTESSLALDSTVNESEIINSTAISQINDTIGDPSQSQISNVTNDTINCDGQVTMDSTLNASEMINSTQEPSTINETNLTNGTITDGTQINSACANETTTIDSQLDPSNQSNLTTISANEALQTPPNHSACEKAECIVNNRNIFRINEEYLKLNEVFRLPLSVLQQDVNITLNVFGIPFGRLRRQVKFALPKDFDSLRTTNKRARDVDECSTTTARKFVKLNDGTATPSIELIAPTEQTPLAHCDHLNNQTIVPASDPNTADTPLEASSEQVNGTSLEIGITADCSVGESPPIGDGLSITQDTLENPSQLVDGATESHLSAIADDFGVSDCLSNDDGPALEKMPRLDSQCDALSVFDSGIGTGTEGSLVEGSITKRRMTLDLTPPSEQIENELSAEADAQSANRIQEMTNLSEKVHSWHQRLKPILLHSEKRNDFDVKETSRNIIARLSSDDDSSKQDNQTERIVSFENVMENRDKADTARYFFSMLQMANNRNIEIIVNHKDSSKLCPQDKIMLKLLDPNIREIKPNIENN